MIKDKFERMALSWNLKCERDFRPKRKGRVLLCQCVERDNLETV